MTVGIWVKVEVVPKRGDKGCKARIRNWNRPVISVDVDLSIGKRQSTIGANVQLSIYRIIEGEIKTDEIRSGGAIIDYALSEVTVIPGKIRNLISD